MPKCSWLWECVSQSCPWTGVTLDKSDKNPWLVHRSLSGPAQETEQEKWESANWGLLKLMLGWTRGFPWRFGHSDNIFSFSQFFGEIFSLCIRIQIHIFWWRCCSSTTALLVLNFFLGKSRAILVSFHNSWKNKCIWQHGFPCGKCHQVA